MRKKLTVISGDHAAGKSVIIQGIEWALWGESSGKISSKTLINEHVFEGLEEKEHVSVSF